MMDTIFCSMANNYQLRECKDSKGEYKLTPKHPMKGFCSFQPQYQVPLHLIQDTLPVLQTLLGKTPQESSEYNLSVWVLLTPPQLREIDPGTCFDQKGKGTTIFTNGDWKVIMGIHNPGWHMDKLALLDRSTQQMAIVTRALPTHTFQSKTIQTHDPNWNIFRSPMMAPLIFWHHLYLTINDPNTLSQEENQVNPTSIHQLKQLLQDQLSQLQQHVDLVQRQLNVVHQLVQTIGE